MGFCFFNYVVRPRNITLRMFVYGNDSAFGQLAKSFMNNSLFDYEKALQSLLYVVTGLPTPGLHASFNVLYFAEQQYLRDWGNSLTGDVFIKMKDGPVPSSIYDMVKAAAKREHGQKISEEAIAYAKRHLYVKGHTITALSPPNKDFLAQTEILCLDNAVALCRNLSFPDIRDMSHDKAWLATEINKPMDPLQIAAAAGADEVALEYLRESLSNNAYHTL